MNLENEIDTCQTTLQWSLEYEKIRELFLKLQPQFAPSFNALSPVMGYICSTCHYYPMLVNEY